MTSTFKRSAIGLLGLALTVPAGLVLAAPAQATSGGQVYSCTAPVVNSTNTTVTYDSNLPDKLYVGDPDWSVGMYSKGVIPSSTMDMAYNLYGARWVQGTTTLPFTFNGVTTTYSASSEMTQIVKGKDTVLEGTKDDVFKVVVPAAPGSYNLTLAKKYSSNNVLYKDDKKSVAMNPGASDCTRANDITVDTVEVWSRASTVLSMPSTALTVGQTSTVTATITSPGAAPAGTVEFMVDGTKVVANVANGKATATFPAKPAGEYTVSAVYQPTGAMVEAQAIAPLTVAVGPANTSTSLSVTPTRVVQGKPVSAHIKVSSPAGTPDGTVQLDLDGQTLSGTLQGGESAVELPTDLALGTHTLSASYLPGASGAFKPSAAEAIQFVVREPATPTVTTMTLDPPVSEAGQVVKASVAVTSDRGVPEGSVKVQAGARSVTGTLVDGKAVVSLPLLAVGEYDVTASFTAVDPELFDNSQSTVVPLRVNAAANVITTTTSLTLLKSTVRSGVNPQASVYINTDSGPLPDGTVEVAVDGRTSTGTVVEGVAHVNLPKLAPGSYPVDAVFHPANPGGYADSVSTVRTLTVEAAPSRTDLTLSLARATVDEPVTATVQVQGTDASGSPAGSVTVQAGGQQVSGALTNGAVVLTLPALPAGTHQVSATYSPATGGWLAPSSAPAVGLVVVAPAVQTSAALSLDRATVGEGQRGLVTATVAADGTVPEGTVTFAVNGSATQVRLVNGEARFSLPLLSVGVHQITGSFAPADARAFKASSATAVSVTVVSRAPAETPTVVTTTKVVAPGKATVGSSFTATASVTGNGAVGSVLFTSEWGSVRATLVNGQATARLTAAAVGTQSVSAEFIPADVSKFTGSLANTSVAVAKRASTVKVKAKAAVKKKRLTLKATVAPVDQFCGGTVTWQVKRGARLVKKVTAVPSCRGVATVSLALPKKKGVYSVLATFGGTSTVAGSRGVTTFKR